MKKLLIYTIPVIIMTSSCTDKLDNYNVDPKSATIVPGATFVTGAQKNLTNLLTSTSVNNNPFRFYSQFWAATTYPDESQYDIGTRQVDRNFWEPLYRDVLGDLKEAKTTITADPVLDAKVKANQLAIIEVLEVYAWSVLVNTFGDVPYTEALDISKPLPKYDDDAAIYASLIDRLNGAIAKFDVTAVSLGSADLIYKGNVGKWIKFANSLKLRMGISIADVDPAKAKTLVEAAAPNVFTSSVGSATLQYLNVTPNNNPLWNDLVNSGRADFVGANTFINKLNSLLDPRRDDYFKPMGDGSFVGGQYGAPNSYANYSAPGTKLESQTLPGELLTYSEVEFLLAEAVERGFNVGGTAAGHYSSAVTASILDWGGTAAEATAYLGQSSVAYATAAGDYKEKIGVQKWISLYLNPVEAWKEWRRLDKPNLVKPVLGRSEIPLRLTYPATESNVNTANYNAASAAIGGNEVTSKIFWDK